MRKIGERTEQNGRVITTVYIVEMPREEYNKILNAPATSHLQEDYTDRDLWSVRFGNDIIKLNLPVKIHNALKRALTDYSGGRKHYTWVFQAQPNGPPLEFREWVERIVTHYDRQTGDSRVWGPQLEFKNVGKGSSRVLLNAIFDYHASLPMVDA